MLYALTCLCLFGLALHTRTIYRRAMDDMLNEGSEPRTPSRPNVRAATASVAARG